MNLRTELKTRLDDVGLGEQIGADRFYPTVQAAVEACVREEKTQGASGVEP